LFIVPTDQGVYLAWLVNLVDPWKPRNHDCICGRQGPIGKLVHIDGADEAR
jgi:hypothetical protein